MSLVLFGAGLFIFEPFMSKSAARLFPDDYQETALHHLLSRKDSIYTAMKDLEFDYQTGKLSDEDYGILRRKFVVQVSSVLEEIDTMRSGREGKEGGAKAGTKKKAAVKTATANEKTCDECGFAHDEDDKFCQGCGAELA